MRVLLLALATILLAITTLITLNAAHAGVRLPSWQTTAPPDDMSYAGGVGLITDTGETGMFLNPTSGIYGKGLSLQYCVLLQEIGGDDLERQTVFAAASKGVQFAGRGPVRGVRVHAGVRQF